MLHEHSCFGLVFALAMLLLESHCTEFPAEPGVTVNAQLSLLDRRSKQACDFVSYDWALLVVLLTSLAVVYVVSPSSGAPPYGDCPLVEPQREAW